MARKQKESALPSIALVFGYIAVKDEKRAEDKIKILDRLGYGNKEIATICNTSPGRVAVVKSIHKRKKGR